MNNIATGKLLTSFNVNTPHKWVDATSEANMKAVIGIPVDWEQMSEMRIKQVRKPLLRNGV